MLIDHDNLKMLKRKLKSPPKKTKWRNFEKKITDFPDSGTLSDLIKQFDKYISKVKLISSVSANVKKPDIQGFILRDKIRHQMTTDLTMRSK